MRTAKGIYMLQRANKTLDIYLYGTVKGDRFDFWTGKTVKSTTSAEHFRELLENCGEQSNINLYINSLGGSCFEGHAIYNILKRNKAHKTAYIDGYACSVASVIACACDEVVMPRNTLMFLHNAWTSVDGNSAQLRKAADDLDVQNEAFKNTYLEKSGGKLSLEAVSELMDNESYLTADMCFKLGLADKVETYDVELSEPEDDEKNDAKELRIDAEKIYALIKGNVSGKTDGSEGGSLPEGDEGNNAPKSETGDGDNTPTPDGKEDFFTRAEKIINSFIGL